MVGKRYNFRDTDGSPFGKRGRRPAREGGPWKVWRENNEGRAKKPYGDFDKTPFLSKTSGMEVLLKGTARPFDNAKNMPGRKLIRKEFAMGNK